MTRITARVQHRDVLLAIIVLFAVIAFAPAPGSDLPQVSVTTYQIGITGTPVIDIDSGMLYVVAKSKESGQVVQRLHALDVATGTEQLGGPVTIAGSVHGKGAGSSSGRLAFDPLRENQRPGLLLQN